MNDIYDYTIRYEHSIDTKSFGLACTSSQETPRKQNGLPWLLPTQQDTTYLNYIHPLKRHIILLRINPYLLRAIQRRSHELRIEYVRRCASSSVYSQHLHPPP